MEQQREHKVDKEPAVYELHSETALEEESDMTTLATPTIKCEVFAPFPKDKCSVEDMLFPLEAVFVKMEPATPEVHNQPKPKSLLLSKLQNKTENSDVSISEKAASKDLGITLDLVVTKEVNVKDKNVVTAHPIIGARKCVKQNLKSDLADKPFECNICEFKTAYSHSLKQHMKTHTGEKPFECNICEFKTIARGYLKRHMVVHTGEKPFECNYKMCKFKTAQKTSLMHHMKIHAGDKAFQCTICEYKAVLKTNLRRHMRIHTGEKPYACDICEYKATASHTLKRHMKKHTGEKYFECNMCEYKTIDKGNLSRHMILHMDEEPTG